MGVSGPPKKIGENWMTMKIERTQKCIVTLPCVLYFANCIVCSQRNASAYGLQSRVIVAMIPMLQKENGKDHLPLAEEAACHRYHEIE